MKDIFRKAASKTAYAMGTASAFLISVVIVIVWGLSGPVFNYSDTWQLYINTGTTVATFLMVFLIQNTQNRDAKAMHLKLDELIRSTKSARNSFMDLENFTDEDLEILDREFQEMHEGLKDNSTLRRLRKKIQTEKERRVTIRKAGKAAGQAITTILKAPVSVVRSSTDKTTVKIPKDDSK